MKIDISSFDSFMQSISENRENKRLVKKSVPAKKEWIEAREKALSLAAKARTIVEEADQILKKTWAQIELGLDDFSTDKRWSENGKEIEILADKSDKQKEGEPVKSPFQKGAGL